MAQEKYMRNVKIEAVQTAPTNSRSRPTAAAQPTQVSLVFVLARLESPLNVSQNGGSNRTNKFTKPPYGGGSVHVGELGIRVGAT
jgi:hypothetical protein